MKVVLSQKQKDIKFVDELVELINKRSNIKAKRVSSFFYNSYADGYTILIKDITGEKIDFVCYKNVVSYYTRDDVSELPNNILQVIRIIEHLTKKDVIVRHSSEISFGGE